MTTHQEHYKNEFYEFKKSLKSYIEQNLDVAKSHHKNTHSKMIEHAKRISDKVDELERVVRKVSKVKAK